ncbi:MAG: hypothetical protein WBY47_08435 [Desulfobacterales bacterium]|jgi:hypothetical protein
MEHKRLERGLEEISHIFLSDGNKVEDRLHTSGNHCEIKETVAVRKKLSFYNHRNVQQHIKESLAKHLEEGYQLRRICLQKKEMVSKPNNIIHREEEVIISIK